MVLSFQIYILLMLGISMAVGDQSCGIERFHQQKDRRIVGGSESEEGAWPWQVALLAHGKQYCAGSLVAPNWVVTAAHCFNEYDPRSSKDPDDWTVVLGDHHLGNREVFEQRRGIKALYIHPKFVDGDYTPSENDIALVRLSEPAVYDDYVSPICLLPSKMKFPWGRECHITGWGHTQENGAQPDILREAKVRLVSPKVCNRAYWGIIHKTALCAGFEKGGVDACQFDSGGPLACDERGRSYLTGIVSWGYGCARPHKYGVYSNMFKLTTWVKKMMKKHNNVES